jgi:hypothetical protein
MKHLPISILVSCLIFFFACEPQDEIISNDKINLTFSQDTVSFDTIFTTNKSVSKRLSVLNPNKNAVKISRIALRDSQNTPFSLVIKGKKQDFTEDILLLGKDSLLILVEANLENQNQNLPFLIENAITFEANQNVQEVPLRAWGQDAKIFTDSTICNSVWTAERPYLIDGYVFVDSLCELQIEEGTQIHFMPNSRMIVQGSLKINGSAENPVNLQGVRREEDYQNAFGQWDKVWFIVGSHDNLINHAIIKNGFRGIEIGTPDEDSETDLLISNTVIENMSDVGVLCYNSDVEIQNTLVNNCITYAVATFAGGNYQLKHNTFANFSFNFFRETPVFAFSNAIPNVEGAEFTNELNLEVSNTIIWGSLENELIFLNDPSANFSISMQNNILKTELEDFDGTTNILNQDPKFKDAFEQIFELDTLSPAKDAGMLLDIRKDILGNARDEKPDIGAFERIE